MLVELLNEFAIRNPASVPVLIVACFIALYQIWSLINLYGRGGEFQGIILSSIVMTLLFVILGIIAWKEHGNGWRFLGCRAERAQQASE